MIKNYGSPTRVTRLKVEHGSPNQSLQKETVALIFQINVLD